MGNEEILKVPHTVHNIAQHHISMNDTSIEQQEEMDHSNREQHQPWTLTCGSPLIERETAKHQLENSISGQNILWDKLQSVFVTCFKSKSSVAKQETIAFLQQLSESGQIDRDILAEKILSGIEKCSEDLTEPPLELFSFLIGLIFVLQSENTRNFYLVRLLSNQFLEDIVFYVLCQYFMSYQQEEKLKSLELLLSPFSTLLCEHKKTMEQKIFYFLSTIYDYFDEVSSSEKKEILLVIVLRLLAIKPKSSLLSFAELGLLQKLWTKSSRDISHRALILHYVLAQGFEGKPEFILSLWENSHKNIAERKLWQQTIFYYFGRNHWMCMTIWLIFVVLRMGKTRAAFQMKELLDLVFSVEMGNEKTHTSTLYLMEVILIVIEYEYSNLSWISSLKETWWKCKQSNLVDKSMPSEEPMSRQLYGNFTFPTDKFQIFRYFPKWVVSIHMLEDFLRVEGEGMEKLLRKWYNNLTCCSSTLQLWFALCCAHIFRQINNMDRLSQVISLFHEANSIEKLNFLPILFQREWLCQFGKLSGSWLQSWLNSCPVESHYSLILYKWLLSLIGICKKPLRNGNQGIHLYTLVVSIMLKESTSRGEPWKTTVVDEIVYCIEDFPQNSPLQEIAYSWIEYLVEERPTWVAYSLFFIVQQPLVSLSSNHCVPHIAASCIKIVCQLCQAKLLDHTKTFQTLYKWCCSSISDSWELEKAWIEFLGTIMILSSQNNGKDVLDKSLMDSNLYLEIFNWISSKFVNCSIDDHKELRCIMETWLLWLKKCLAIHSIANVQSQQNTTHILEPTQWNLFLETLFEKYFSKDCHMWFSSVESEVTLHQLVATMIQAVELEWQYRKRLEWSAIEQDHSIRKWSFNMPSIQVWLNQLEKYTLQCPYGIIRCCLNHILNFICSLVNGEDGSSKMAQGFYSLWILSYSQVLPFHNMFWQKWMFILSQHWLSWMEQCTRLGWKLSIFTFWISLWSRWSVKISSTCREWLLYEFLENIQVTDGKHVGLEMARFYMLWDLLVGYRPMQIQPNLLLFLQKQPQSNNIITEEIRQNIQKWWKDLFHIIETRLTSVEHLCCLFRFGNWTELILSYQRTSTLSTDTMLHMIKNWIGNQIIWMVGDESGCDISVLSLMRLIEPWKSVDLDWLLNTSDYGKSIMNMRYYCMHKGLCDWKAAFGMDFLYFWIQNEALSSGKEMYLNASLRYGLSQRNLEQMVQTWMDCLSSLLAQDNKKYLHRLLELLYNAWIELHDTKLNQVGCQFTSIDALVQLESWYQILFSTNQKLLFSPIENSILQGLGLFSSHK
ncbi:hypothetical protein Gasu2_00420 [Galdieria sulphuraria]|nr:hypothetical protein Gasu2_00420 [Galdieria sulphuraria]